MGYVKIAAILGVCAIVAYLSFWLYDSGADNERSKIEKENVDAAHRGLEAAMSWRDCRDRNGVYHFDTGKCSWSATGDR